MTLLTLYCIFALTTAIVSIYELLIPVMKAQQKPIDNKILLITTFFVINVIIAPLVFLSCIVPAMAERFREALDVGLFPKA